MNFINNLSKNWAQSGLLSILLYGKSNSAIYCQHCIRGFWTDRWPGSKYLLLIALLACTFPQQAGSSNNWNWRKAFGSWMCCESRELAIPWHCLPLCPFPVSELSISTFTTLWGTPRLSWSKIIFISVKMPFLLLWWTSTTPFSLCVCSPVPRGYLHKIFPSNLTVPSLKCDQNNSVQIYMTSLFFHKPICSLLIKKYQSHLYLPLYINSCSSLIPVLYFPSTSDVTEHWTVICLSENNLISGFHPSRICFLLRKTST